MVEVVELVGQAAHAQLKFGNRKPGSNSPLMFEISKKHLRDCQSKFYFFFNARSRLLVSYH